MKLVYYFNHDGYLDLRTGISPFWQGMEATKQYSEELLLSYPPVDALIFGFTEMGYWGSNLNEETEVVFKGGTEAVMDAIEEFGNIPIIP